MANKIEGFSPKIEIINYFDSMISRVDIDIDQCLEKYDQEKVLSNLNCFDIRKRNVRGQKYIYLNWIVSNKLSENVIQYQTVDEWSESTQVVDYLNRVRNRTVDELKKAQEDTLEYYKQNSSQFKLNDKKLIDEKKADEIKGEIFKEKFYFQVFYKPEGILYSYPWIFNLYTFVTDFYMSQTEIDLLEKFINSPDTYDRALLRPDPNLHFFLDEKMVLIGLLQKHFFDNLKTEKFPSHVITVRKHDILDVKEITCYHLHGVNLSSTTIDLSNLERLNLNGTNPEEIKIEGLSSLKTLRLSLKSLKQVILKNLFALRRVFLSLETPIDSEVLFKFNDYLPNIEKLNLNGIFSYFSLDSLSNLKNLKLDGKILEDFNFQLFDNLCNQLEHITISGGNFDDKCLEKLFYGRNFPYLNKLNINNTLIIKLEKKLFDGLQMLRKLQIFYNKHLRIIDYDTFSNLTQLEELVLNGSCIDSIDTRLFSNLINLKSLNLSENRLEEIEENCFSSLHNLKSLDLSENQLTSLDSKSFVGLDNLIELCLSHNKLTDFDFDIFKNVGKIEQISLYENPVINKEELLNLTAKSKIKVYI